MSYYHRQFILLFNMCDSAVLDAATILLLNVVAD